MSCLFESFAYFIVDGNAEKIRGEICDYLSTNPKLLDNLTLEQISEFENEDGNRNRNISQYVSQMRKSSTWGGAIEIKAFCNIHSINVDVVILQTGKVVHFFSNNQPGIGVATITWNGSHFEPLRNN